MVDQVSVSWASHPVQLVNNFRPIIGNGIYSLVLSHRQDNAKLCVAAHHAGICLGSLFQRIGFDHGAYPAQFGKAKRVIRIRQALGGVIAKTVGEAPEEL